MQKQFIKIQQDMREMLELQRNMMGQLTQLLAVEFEKKSGLVVNSEEDVEEIIYSPGFTAISVPTEPDMQGVPFIIEPQYQIDTSALLSFPMGSSFNPEDDQAKLFVLAETKKRKEWTLKATKKKEREQIVRVGITRVVQSRL
ncbi:hypothetical protein PVK06_005168 [Gossypium arboreum]|uniref:Uncharacterized protein n=1 Tax=Gossypium arboreum TaxID=29729 RepID=A0ABR0QV83_GOSAR|nr:hypothetical protein PVK06_005168 [Gossypium arboreum]